jgi:hypothetical protein
VVRWLGMTLPLAAVAAVLASCASFEPNPLLGRWTMSSPLVPGLVLGTYEFRRSSMTVLGVTQSVEYSVDGNNVLVVPKGIGIGFEITVEDDDTARLNDPVTGGLLTLRRLRTQGL